MRSWRGLTVHHPLRTLVTTQTVQGRCGSAVLPTAHVGYAHCMGALLAHAGQPIVPHDLWSSWGFDPVVYNGLILSGWLYGRGFRRWRGVSRGARVATVGRAAPFYGGLLVCWLALESPVDALGSALFSGHMVQHELLAVVAAPLLVLGRPSVVMVRGLPRSWWPAVSRTLRRTVARVQPSSDATLTTAVFLLFFTSFWLWHVPRLYDAAVRSDLVHSLQHATFLGGAVVFWATIFGRRVRRNGLIGAGLVAPAFLTGAWGGALFTFTRVPLYDAYRTTTEPWGLTPVGDLNIGGAVMLTAGPVYLAAAAWLFLRAVRRSERVDGLVPAVPYWSRQEPAS